MMSLYAFAKDEVHKVRRITDAEKLTIYALFKQAERGDVDEDELQMEREMSGSLSYKL